jgi:hypothetical protein
MMKTYSSKITTKKRKGGGKEAGKKRKETFGHLE